LRRRVTNQAENQKKGARERCARARTGAEFKPIKNHQKLPQK
jgi:hypothetical protein